MSNENIQGMAVVPTSLCGVRVEETSYFCTALVDVVLVVVPNATVYLPSPLELGKQLRIVASNGDVILNGNGLPIVGGAALVLNNTFLDVVSFGDEWIAAGAAQSFDVKANVRVVSTINVARTGLPIIDGVQTLANNRVLLVAETSAVDNGIWITAAGAWTRAADMPAGSGAEGVFTFVSEGTSYADTGWLFTTNAPLDLVGTDPINAVQFSTFPLATVAPVNVTKAAAVIGVSNQAARADHKHDVTTGVAGAIAVGDAAAEGVAASLARSDHTHSLAAPAAPANVTKAAAATGVAATAARADHKHDVTTGVPVNVGTVNAEGTASSLARSDHVHAGSSPLIFKFSGQAVLATDTWLADGGYVSSLVPVNYPVPVPFTATLLKVRLADAIVAAGATITAELWRNGFATGWLVTFTGPTAAGLQADAVIAQAFGYSESFALKLTNTGAIPATIGVSATLSS